LWKRGQQRQLDGDIEGAIETYTQSIQLYPTAEAHTFRGWAYSFQGRIADAIDECKQAIEVDDTFGNPYNDIGSYLIRLGHFDEAVGWLEKAKQAPRYDPRHFPYMNLARLFARQGQLARAIDELNGALREQPDDPSCTRMLTQLRGMLN